MKTNKFSATRVHAYIGISKPRAWRGEFQKFDGNFIRVYHVILKPSTNYNEIQKMELKPSSNFIRVYYIILKTSRIKMKNIKV